MKMLRLFFWNEYSKKKNPYKVKWEGVNVRPNPQTRHEPDMSFYGLGLGLSRFGS